MISLKQNNLLVQSFFLFGFFNNKKYNFFILCYLSNKNKTTIIKKKYKINF